jgi:hypothetical protein
LRLWRQTIIPHSFPAGSGWREKQAALAGFVKGCYNQFIAMTGKLPDNRFKRAAGWCKAAAGMAFRP